MFAGLFHDDDPIGNLQPDSNFPVDLVSPIEDTVGVILLPRKRLVITL